VRVARRDVTRGLEIAGDLLLHRQRHGHLRGRRRDVAVVLSAGGEIETKEAALNLGYTEVKAPFDGIVTARKVSLGELVGANGPTQLATIVQTNPVYVNFTISEHEVLKIRAEMRRLGVSKQEVAAIPIEVGLQNDTGYLYQGTLDYVSPSVAGTGTPVTIWTQGFVWYSGVSTTPRHPWHVSRPV